MDIQFLIVAVIVAAAALYGVVAFTRKSRAFSAQRQCSSDCGCSKSR